MRRFDVDVSGFMDECDDGDYVIYDDVSDAVTQIEFLTKNIKTIKGISERQQEALNRASEYRSEYLDKVRKQSLEISELKYRLTLEDNLNLIDTPMLEMLLKVAEFIKEEIEK